MRPAVEALRSSFSEVREELHAWLASAAERGKLQDAYRDFLRGGTWRTLKLYECSEGWLAEGCGILPSACAALRGKGILASETWPELCAMGLGDAVQLLAVDPGTSVPLHATSNALLNAQLGLEGLAGAELHLGEEVLHWQLGEVIVWQDSLDHAVVHKGDATRWVLTAQLLHPELRETRGGGAGRQAAGAWSRWPAVATRGGAPMEAPDERARRIDAWTRGKLDALWAAGGLLRELVFTY
eukprot:TRINITY_DN39712_c0_g1_i1.p1 TRINITY_DN39712_c0_g1~~TRINITY_DN39712_c0_g1_i1.p1  ORF type:complete len:264 (-),score=54.49 TRINITY_DN39712_c0_g1_i1:63-785(-)